MSSNKNFITNYQFFATIVVAIIGVGNFSYPSTLAQKVGSDGWIVTIISGLVVYLLFYCIYKIEEINDFKDFMTIVKMNFGNFFGNLVALILVIFNIIAVSIGMRVFVEVLKIYLLQKTPTEFIILTMILTGTMFIRCQLQNIIQFNEICFWVTFIPMIFILLILMKNADFKNLLPMFQSKPLNYIKAMALTVFAFEGFEISYLIIPHTKEKKKIPKIMFKCVMFIVIIYSAVTVLSIAIFGMEQTKTLLWPTITMIKSISIPGYFIEQWEGIVMVFWILFYLTTFVNVYYFSSVLLRDIFKLGDNRLTSIITSPFIYIIALYPENLAEIRKLSTVVTEYFYLFSTIILVAVMLIISLVKRRGRNEKK